MKIIQDFKHKARCYYERDDAVSVLKVIIRDGSSANILYRTARFFFNSRLFPVGWILLEINKLLNGCVIGGNAQFDEGFVLMHPIGVIINGGVRGGKNIVIESGVVIGAAKNGLPVLVPALGDNIFIGSGAKILGGIKIGNNVTVGANAVVIKDVPNGATVVGIPARIVGIQEKSN